MKASSKTKQQVQVAAAKTESAPPATVPAAILTRVDPEWGGLPARQRTALIALAAGRGYTDAARAAGVSRQTLHTWRQKDARFAALLNACQNQLFASAQNRLIALTDDAVTTVGDAITTGDVRTALELLRRLGVLAPLQIGSEDPAEMQRQQTLAHSEQQSKAAHREAMLRADKAMLKMLP
jgi:hypothetical protein